MQSTKESAIKSEGGQAVIDYILTLLIVVSTVFILAAGFRKSLFKLWAGMTREISAACPKCPADPKIQLK